MPSKNRARDLAGREAPPILMIIGVVILVLALGTGGYYVFNGGWKTQGQQDYDYKHTMLPINAAKHGDKQPLEEENKLRASHGEPPLEMPKDTKSGTGDKADKLKKLQEQLTAHGAGQ